MPKQPCELIRITVAFNENNPVEKSLLDHVLSQYNRSRYFKRLVERDLNGGPTSAASGIHGIESVAAQSEDELISQLL